jgi:predicted Zn-ribbon and HTH transcriptional regulator
MDFRKGFRRPKAPQKSRNERKNEAEDAMAAFLARGGTVTKAAPVVATTIACSNCGYTGVVGIAEGKSGRCPRCREKLSQPAS